jgi:DNA-binding MarR family transcriptional regulator
VLTTHIRHAYACPVGAITQRVKQRQFRNPAEGAFVGLLVVAEQVHQQLEQLCRQSGITHAQYNVLRILKGVHPEGHPRFEIGNRLIRRAPDVTRLLDRLQQQGLIERAWDQENRRQSIARISERGLTLLRTIEPALARLQQQVLSPLTRDQVQTLATILDQLSRQMERQPAVTLTRPETR